MLSQLKRTLRVPSNGTEVLLFDSTTTATTMATAEEEEFVVPGDTSMDSFGDGDGEQQVLQPKQPQQQEKEQQQHSYYVSPFYELFEVSSILSSTQAGRGREDESHLDSTSKKLRDDNDLSSSSSSASALLLLKFRTCSRTVRELASKNVTSIRAQAAPQQLPIRVSAEQIKVVPLRYMCITFPQFPGVVLLEEEQGLKQEQTERPGEEESITRLRDVESKVLQVPAEVATQMLSMFRNKTLKSELHYEPVTGAETVETVEVGMMQLQQPQQQHRHLQQQQVEQRPASLTICKSAVTSCSAYAHFVSTGTQRQGQGQGTSKAYFSEQDVLTVLQCALLEGTGAGLTGLDSNQSSYIFMSNNSNHNNSVSSSNSNSRRVMTAKAQQVLLPRLQLLARQLFAEMRRSSYEVLGSSWMDQEQDQQQQQQQPQNIPVTNNNVAAAAKLQHFSGTTTSGNAPAAAASADRKSVV